MPDVRLQADPSERVGYIMLMNKYFKCRISVVLWGMVIIYNASHLRRKLVKYILSIICIISIETLGNKAKCLLSTQFKLSIPNATNEKYDRHFFNNKKKL